MIPHEEQQNSLNPLVVVDITEHKSEPGIEVGLEDNYCEYGIKSVWPVEFTNRFNMTNNKLACGDIDRENPQITDMFVSQIQLEIYCGKTPVSQNRWVSSVVKNEKKYNYDRNWINTPNIYFDDAKYVSVIVNDVNDNKPIFDERSKLVIGYPSTELANSLKIPYLVQVHVSI